MGRNIRTKNKDTGKWEIAASGNAVGISSTNPNFLEEGENVISVDEAMNRLNEKIKKLERNVSWLALYGGSGSGSGSGGGMGDAVFTVTNATQSQGSNIVYTSTEKVTLSYLINAKRNNQKYYISVVLDGNSVINNQIGWSGVSGTLVIDNVAQYSNLSTHNVTITVTDAEGINLEPYLLTIVESSIKLTSRVTGVTATIGLPYKITYSIVNKIVNKETNLIVTNVTNGISKTYELGVFNTTGEILHEVNFFEDLFPTGTTPTTGSSYTIEAYAETIMDDGAVRSDIATNRVIIEDGVNLVVLVDGITTKDEVTVDNPATVFTQDGNISFSFTPYLAGVSIIYYALQLSNGKVTETIGNFNPSADNPLTANQYVQKGNQQLFSWSIPQESNYLGTWTITLRCWSEKGSPMVDTVLVCNITEATQVLLEDQNPNSSRYAWWNIKSSSFPQRADEATWESVEENYKVPGSSVSVVNKTNMNVYNTNGTLSGFLTQAGQNKLRLAGESYAIIDVAPFNSAVGSSDNWGTVGFGFSCTFKTDKHPFSDRTVLFIGDYSEEDGSLLQGIKIGLEEIIWKYGDGELIKTISCRIQQNVINSVDFILEKTTDDNPSWVVKIFINGVLNVAAELTGEFRWNTSSKIYLACDKDPLGNVDNFSDVEFYDVKLFRYPLNDKEVVINSMNSRAKANLNTDGTIKFTEYNNWKNRNFFPAATGDIYADAASSLWDNVLGSYKAISFDNFISDSNRKPPLPVLLIECTDSSSFTRAVYEKIGANPAWYLGCNLKYFDPNSARGSVAQTGDVAIQIQGTSSTGYRSKNLEIRFDKRLKNGEPELFQPKDTWMPENQFTLKADVVDSAHANNASIGKWINDNADELFDKTPPMVELESHLPVDTLEPSIKHENVTIKHTLEGFPVILLIRFAGEATDTMLGIYSFNLGRNSFYNMGFKFFKSFTTKSKGTDGQISDVELPAFITDYETYKIDEPFGSIDQRQIYSYEFSENANTIEADGKIQPTALFWQDDLSIIKHVGEFRYNGASGSAANVTDDAIWGKLQLLFSCLSRMTNSEVAKYAWDNDKRSYYELAGQKYPAINNWSSDADLLDLRLNLKNAYSYFMICIAFGLVDSLGKNMVLRSWNVGEGENMNKWWPCFYDMDTATGLSNTGEENVKKTAYIDIFKNAEVEEGVNSLQISSNSADGGYDTYSSRLWNVLRDSIFINTGKNNGLTYGGVWSSWRKNINLINNASNFVDKYFSSQTIECGELLYNYDYKVKYLTKYASKEGAVPTYANVTFLHGTRTEFVRDWLKKRFYFFDGVYLYSDADVPFPYNTKGTFSCGGALSANPVLKVKCNTPMIFTVNIGQTTYGDIRYFVDENTPTDIVLMPISSFNMQVTINAVNEISELSGLKDMRFQRFMPGLMSLPSFAEVDLFNVKTLESNPVDFGSVFISSTEDYSEVRHINLANTAFWSGSSVANPEFVVDIEKYPKLKTLDISNSCVTSIKLPSASLTRLNITNSAINKINLQSQPFLESIDFTGCNKLTEVIINNCSKIKSISLNNLKDLKSLVITGCPNLTTISCTGNKNLIEFKVEAGCLKLSTVDLSNCSNSNLSIYLVGADNIKSLKVPGTTTTKTIEMAGSVTSMTTLDLSNSSVKAIQFGANPVPTIDSEPILDLSNLTVSSLTMKNMAAVKYIKFDNNSTKPIGISSNFFVGCTSLVRVFGHIKLTGTGTFNGCKEFYIHELSTQKPVPIPSQSWYGPDTNTDNGKKSWNDGVGLDTNITLSTVSMASQFRETACNLTDVYYILKLCSNVTSLSATFYGCRNIKTSSDNNSFRRDMFAYCGNVVTIDSLFYACGSLNGIYYSPSHNDDGTISSYDGLLSPLKSLTSASSAFNTGGTKYLDDMFFAGLDSSGNKLKLTALSYMFDTAGSTVRFIKNTSPTSGRKETVSTSDYEYAKASRLFANLPQLTSITGMFNGTQINFDTKTYGSDGTVYCPMFYNNPRLTSIYLSFRSVTGTGSMANLFGGNSAFASLTSNFPQKLESIRNSFLITSGSVSWPISNDMFDKIASTLKYITGEETNNVTYTSSTSSFNGAGLNKTYTSDGSGNFPYNVFSKCRELREIPAFFSGLNYTPQGEISLPGNMFLNNTKLTNISSLFNGMSSSIKYTLIGKGFRNCSLKNVAYAFDETSGNYSKTGYIPYGLFYQEKTEIKSVEGWTADNDLGINEEFGIKEDGSWDSSVILPSPQNISFSRTVPNRTITNMYQCLGHFSSSNAAGYTKNIGKVIPSDYGDLVIPNESYNPVKYIKNPKYSPEEELEITDPVTGAVTKVPNPARDIRRVILNTEYDGYGESWNRWVVDGLNGLENTVLNSTLYSAKAGSDPLRYSLPANLPEEFNILDDTKTCQNTGLASKRRVMNYICPPDLFRYCENSGTTNINYALASSGREEGTGYTYTSYGLPGRIPPHLFEPVSNINTISGVFYYCKMLNPASWSQDNSEIGKMYPESLFAKNTSLSDITTLFAFTEVPDGVEIPSNLFTNNIALRTLDRLWMGTKWNGTSTTKSQVPDTLFSVNTSINNIRGMFASYSVTVNSDNSSTADLTNYSGRPPKYINGAVLFNSSVHKNITNCSWFIVNGTGTYGTIPEFWKWLTSLSANNRTSPFYGVYKSRVTNEDSAPAEWLTGMVG